MKSSLPHNPKERTPAQEADYWNAIVSGWPNNATVLWREHSDRVNGELLTRWLPKVPIGRVLKTDLFDEAVGEGLYPMLPQQRVAFFAIDLSKTAVARAIARYSAIRGLVADARRLPFKTGSFDLILSNSTLDHFQRLSEVGDALAELNRVLNKGGELIITLDNSRNPIVALRKLVQTPLLRLGLLPYFTGPTCDAGGLRRLLTESGFVVRDETTLFHMPRLPAMAVGRLLDFISVNRLRQGYLACLGAVEHLAGSSVANTTGYFVAARAVKT